MSKFKLKIADSKQVYHVPLALGVPLERTQQITAECFKQADPEQRVAILKLVEDVIEKCDTLEEVVAMAFLMGGYHEQETAHLLALADAAEEMADALATATLGDNKPIAEA